MDFAILAPPLSNRTSDPEWLVEYAQHVEACGFESIVLVEHAVMFAQYSSSYPYAPSGRVELPPDCELPDPLDALAFLAGQTTRLKLATGVLVLPVQHPVVLAKRLATVDRLSQGRLRVGVGMGWMHEEIAACGVDPTTRGRRADEQIEVMHKLWAGGPGRDGEAGVDHEGEFFSFRGAVSRPLPVQSGGVPIHIGGHSKAAARRAGRLGNGLAPLGVAGDELAGLLGVMRQAAEQAGRDPESLEVTLGHLIGKITPERAESLAARGATRINLAATATDDLSLLKDELSECAERLGLGR